MFSRLIQRVLRISLSGNDVSKFIASPCSAKNVNSICRMSTEKTDQSALVSNIKPAIKIWKKPLNSYVRFFQEKMPEIKKANPDFRLSEVMDHITQLWYRLPSEEKQKLQDAFNEENEIFRKNKEDWWANLPEHEKEAYLLSKKQSRQRNSRLELKRKLKRLGMPKRPKCAGRHFALIQSASDLKNGKPKKSLEEIRKIWKNMNESDRIHYDAIAKEDMERFIKEMLVWELKMMREGHGDLIHMADLTLRLPKYNFGTRIVSPE